MPRANRNTSEPPIARLRNLGPRSAAMLASIGITTLEQLRKRGAVAAYVMVKHQQPSASLNLLYALVGMLSEVDWKIVQRERKLELILAVEDYERQHPVLSTGKQNGRMQDALLSLRNIGKAMRADFELLGINSIEQLARCDADELYVRIQTLTHSRHDPCVWDTYAAAIHQAKTGEARAWWEFTKVRKQRQANCKFILPADSFAAGKQRKQAIR
ncbi:MAG: TfoX/Sxy family DNA transformation protein [Steroidobacteraceae bacterium]